MRSDLPDLVFQYDVRLLKHIVSILRAAGYSRIQSTPLREHPLGLTREPFNLLQFFLLRRANLLFGISAFPAFYRRTLALVSPKQSVLLRACFLNEWISREEVVGFLGEELSARAEDNRILLAENGRSQFSLSFVPVDDMICVRDPYYAYLRGGPDFPQRVWMGSDTLSFVQFLTPFLRSRPRFSRALEVGSGTGIPILTVSPHADRCEAIDYNPRAVRFTQINAELNGVDRLVSQHSDLFENVRGQFDLIIANPWYCDLETGGLEEVPALVSGLEQHLRGDGLCVMILNSYVKQGRDCAHEFLKEFAETNRYDLDLFVLLYDVPHQPVEELRRHGITHSVCYHAVLKKAGRGIVRRYPSPLLRRLWHVTKIGGFRWRHGL